MGRYITTKADFTLRRKHKKGSGSTIYENDYTTINPMPNALKGEYVIGDSNFVFTSRLGINGQKKHVRGKFVLPPVSGESSAWTIDTMVDTGITDETKIRLKPNYTSIKDFACYGSANKLIQGTINGVITDFPAEIWFSNSELSEIKFYESNTGAGYSFNDCDEDGNPKEPISIEKIVYNEYGIDIMTKNVQEGSVYNPLRYFSLCGSSYTLVTVDESGNTYEFPFTGFDVVDTSSGECYEGKSIEVDKLAVVTMDFSGIRFEINVYKDNTDGNIYYTYSTQKEILVPIFVNGSLVQDDISTISFGVDGILKQSDVITRMFGVNGTLLQNASFGTRALRLGAGENFRDGLVDPSFLYNAHIRPKKQIVEQYFRDCDDFTAVLLDRVAKPIYTAIFETPRETDTGFVYDMKSYVWPTLLGGYNPDLSGPYYSYVQSLIDLADFYDEYYSDNMWRSLTHEAIKTLDWTYISNSNGDIQDMSTIDTSRIEPITKIYGRQFDDLKRYADGIKSINTITYNQKSNTPDYTLTDILANSGWETKTLKLSNDKDLRTKSLYDGLTSGFTASDADNEFLRRLKLNSRYLFSTKGTRKGLDAMLAMFGFTPDDYKIHEFVYVFSGTKDYPPFCTDGTPEVYYPLAEDVTKINKYKINFNAFDPYGDFCGIPVTEVGSTKGNYVVPWYSQGKTYDDGLYFQVHGGWGRRRSIDIDLEIAPGVSAITEQDNVPFYTETQARMKFAKDFDELLQEAFNSPNLYDVFYVTDISDITTTYSSAPGENPTGASHYFVLENKELNQFLGYSTNIQKYGWRSVSTEELQNPDTYSAGTLVLYLESIKDDTTGNNPHIGNGTYDDGMTYISGMSEIFNYSLINKNFIGIDDDSCSAISKYRFEVEKQEDNRKCWFFSDDYNFKFGKTINTVCSGATTGGSDWSEFREVDVTDERCDTKKAYEIIDMLEEASPNCGLTIGQGAESDMLDNYAETYNRQSDLNTFDPEEGTTGVNGEAAANSVVNVKNLEIEFFIPYQIVREEDKKAYKQYIETSVIPYLTQMIPSTSIFSWNFNEQVIPTIKTTVSGEFRQEQIPTVSTTVSGRFKQEGTIPPGPEITSVKVSGTFKQEGSAPPPGPETTSVKVSGVLRQEPPEIEPFSVNVSGKFVQS